MKQYLWILELTFRWFVCIKLWVYGSGKILGGQFHRAGDIPEVIGNTPLAAVGGFDLAWTFFGYSFGYILFIGLSQIIGGGMLLFNKTKLLGVAILFPILLNIIVVDFFFEVSRGAMASAIIYLGMCCYILYYNKKRLGDALKKLMTNIKNPKPKKAKWIGYSLVVALLIILSFVEVFIINLAGR